MYSSVTKSTKWSPIFGARAFFAFALGGVTLVFSRIVLVLCRVVLVLSRIMSCCACVVSYCTRVVSSCLAFLLV